GEHLALYAALPNQPELHIDEVADARSGHNQDHATRCAGLATARAGLQQQGDRQPAENQSADGQATLAHIVLARRYYRRPQACEACHCRFHQGADQFMQPRYQLTNKEMQVATLVWEGLTNREIAKLVGTTEQVVKNYLRTTFDKLGVWSRLELAIYVASHGGSRWTQEFRSDQ